MRAGTKFLLVPYPNMGVALQDAMASRIDLGIFSTSVIEAAIRDGKVKAIAAIADKRLPSFPRLADSFGSGSWHRLRRLVHAARTGEYTVDNCEQDE